MLRNTTKSHRCSALIMLLILCAPYASQVVAQTPAAKPAGAASEEKPAGSKSDTPRKAGGLMSWAASKAVGPLVQRRRALRASIHRFRIARCYHPRLPARGCIGGPAPGRTQPWTPRNRVPRNVHLQSSSPSLTTARWRLRSFPLRTRSPRLPDASVGSRYTYAHGRA